MTQGVSGKVGTGFPVRPAGKAGATETVPALRFPEFSGGWEQKLLGDFFSFKNGVNADKSMYGAGNKFINVLDVIADHPITSGSIIGRVTVSDDEFAKNEVRYGDILFQRSSETREEVGQTNVYLDETRTATFGGFVIRGRPIAPLNSEFFNRLLMTRTVRKEVTNRSGGSTRYNVGQETLASVPVSPAPSLPEQKKIAAFLGVVDAKIAALRGRKAGLDRYKRGLMQALFSGRLRFTKEGGSAFPDWEERRLGEVLHEHKAKSTGLEQVFSVSVHKGLVNQVEHLGRSFSAATTDHYNRVKPHDIVYTKSPTGDFPLGIIKQSHVDSDVIVSPLYGVFTPETPALGFILHVHFESNVNVSNYLSPIVQKGAKNTINVTNNGFLSNKLVLPVDPDEQQKIADALQALDAKIAATFSTKVGTGFVVRKCERVKGHGQVSIRSRA